MCIRDSALTHRHMLNLKLTDRRKRVKFLRNGIDQRLDSFADRRADLIQWIAAFPGKSTEGFKLFRRGQVALIGRDDLRTRGKLTVEIRKLRVDRAEILNRVAPF